MADESRDITQYLLNWSQGDHSALERLMPIVYDDLRRLARRKVFNAGPLQIDPTVLVHDAYIRLIDQTRVNWQNRAHFFAIAAEIIRRVMVDHVRTLRRKKRGGDAHIVTLHTQIADDSSKFDVESLNDALERLSAIDQRQARIIELRFFAGL